SPHMVFAMPTGTMPRASGTSWLPQFTVATRWGSDSMTVWPKAWSICTGQLPLPELEPEVPAGSSDRAELEQPARPMAPSAAVPSTARRVGRYMWSFRDGPYGEHGRGT